MLSQTWGSFSTSVGVSFLVFFYGGGMVVMDACF